MPCSSRLRRVILRGCRCGSWSCVYGRRVRRVRPRDHLTTTDATIVVVTFGAVDQFAAYRCHLAIPFTVLADPDRRAYRDYELQRGTVRNVYGIGTMRTYAALVRTGRKLRRPTGDTLQLGGDLVIDRDGRNAAALFPDSPDDRPTVQELAFALADAP